MDNIIKFSRELEKKFVLKGINYTAARNVLLGLSEPTCPNQSSSDLYWAGRDVDFVRLRANSREITVKVTDRGTVIDRIEENVEVTPEAFPAAARLLTLLLGAPTLKLTKEFSVFRLPVTPAPGTAFEAILCLYQVQGDPLERVFFEVEAESLAVVDYVLNQLEGTFNLVQEHRSLYQIFIGDDK